MRTATVHSCPRCELRFGQPVELMDHLRRDHPGLKPVTLAPQPHGRVVLAVDPARPAPRAAAGVASTLATQLGASIEVVASTPPGLGEATTVAYLHDRVRECRAAGAAWVGSRDLDDAPAAAVAAEAGNQPSTWICLSSRARTAVGEKVFGSVAEEILERAAVPVLVVGPQAESTTEPFSRVVACVDRKPSSARVAAAAADLAERLDCRLVLVEVSVPTIDGDPLLDDRHLRRLARRLSPLADTILLAGYREWQPILDLAGSDPTTILVTGRRPPSAPGHFVIGSVATNLARKAHGPVMVVPNPAEDG